jgi:hypothetical protein
VNRAVAFRSDFQPDWISLQFVPYGFQDKGVIAGLANHLQRIAGSSSKFHIMFHELWIGIEHAASVKRRLIGALQRRFVFDMIRKLKPAVIHTNTPLYEMILQQWGFTASVLPLFGNISICAHGDAQWLWDELGAAGCQVTNKNRSKFWLAGFFGTLHSEWEPEPLLGLLHRAAEDTGRRVCLLALGRLGTGNARWDDLARRNADNFFFAKIGEQAGNRISQCLQSLDFGVAVSPLQLIGKSSTTATMLDHGLPVVVTRCNARSSIPFIATPFTDPLIHLLDDSFSSKLANGFPKREARHRLQSVAKRFLHQFTYNEDGARKQYEHI